MKSRFIDEAIQMNESDGNSTSVRRGQFPGLPGIVLVAGFGLSSVCGASAYAARIFNSEAVRPEPVVVSDVHLMRSRIPVEARLAETVQSLVVDTKSEKEARDAFLKAIEGSSWKVRFFSFRRSKVNRGLKTNIRMEVDTGSSCVRNEKWIELLGKPAALNLAQPYGFVDISTPEEVDRHLTGHVVALHYRLDEYNAYAIYSDDDSGCFDYLRVNEWKSTPEPLASRTRDGSENLISMPSSKTLASAPSCAEDGVSLFERSTI